MPAREIEEWIVWLELRTRTDPDGAAEEAVVVFRRLLRENRDAADMALRRSLDAGAEDCRLPDGPVFRDRMRRLRDIVDRHTMFDREAPRKPDTALERSICVICEMLLEMHP